MDFIPSSSAELRQRLQRLLRTDADFEAFCQDYLPSVSQRFSAGMERQAKVNLLLSLVPPEKLELSLSRFGAADAGKLAAGRPARPRANLVVFGALLMAAGSVLLYLRTESRADVTARTTIDSESIVITEPAGATVVLLRTNRNIGTTPFRTAAYSGEHVCLLFEGHAETELALLPGQTQRVRLRPILTGTAAPHRCALKLPIPD